MATKKSPLAGTKLALLPPEQKQRIELVREVCRLGEYFKDVSGHWDDRLVESDDGDLSIGGYDCRSERHLSFTRDGTVKLMTWDTSGHNGDPYNEKEVTLDHAEAVKALDGLKHRLRERAIKREVELLEQHKQKRLEADAAHNLDAKLRGI